MTLHTRHNTHVCTFEKESPRLTACAIHERMKVEESVISIIQTDGPKRHAYIKITAAQRPMDILSETNGSMQYDHREGRRSTVTITLAGLGMRRARIDNCPPHPKGTNVGHTALAFRRDNGKNGKMLTPRLPQRAVEVITDPGQQMV